MANPALGRSIPVNIDMVVVLPAPLWPRSAKIWPSYMRTFTPSTARRPLPKVLCRSSIFKNLFCRSKLSYEISGGSKLSGSIYFVSKSSSISISSYSKMSFLDEKAPLRALKVFSWYSCLISITLFRSPRLHRLKQSQYVGVSQSHG